VKYAKHFAFAAVAHGSSVNLNRRSSRANKPPGVDHSAPTLENNTASQQRRTRRYFVAIAVS
jgi:hypothetical protein